LFSSNGIKIGHTYYEKNNIRCIYSNGKDWTYRRMPWIPDEFLLAFVFVASQDWTYRRMPWIPDEFLLAFVFVAGPSWSVIVW
jgi:hypothetical protein